MRRKSKVVAGYCSLIFAALAAAERPRISEDRELKEIDLTAWECRNHAEGSAKTPDGVARNRLKNRPVTQIPGARAVALDTSGFLRFVGELDGLTRGKRRKDLSAAQQAAIDKQEKQLVSLTGYLVLAYAGPPESTNCASTDFHDWHLEVFAKPSDHPPGMGDPAPIICEITPRTQTAIYRDGTRLQDLAAFIRAPNLSHEPTGHPTRKIRLTGYLLWDDEHNGASDIGVTINSVGANGYHQPWRSTAWEIHPVVKIELMDNTASANPTAAPITASPTAEATPPAAEASEAAAPPTESSTPTPSPGASERKEVILMRAVTIKIPYGQTVVPRGSKLPLISRAGDKVTVQYLGQSQIIPLDATDLR